MGVLFQSAFNLPWIHLEFKTLNIFQVSSMRKVDLFCIQKGKDCKAEIYHIFQVKGG